MSSNQKKWELKSLLQNLKQHRDAVVVIGDKAVKELELYNIDENSKKDLNRKKMVKEPKKFWSFYKENIYQKNNNMSLAEENLNSLIGTGLIKTVVNLNNTGNIKVPICSNTQLIPLRGVNDVARCMSCDKTYKITQEMLDTQTVLKCECGGKIAPTVTMFGEKYLEKHIKALKESVVKTEDEEVKLNTHCLIFVGVDFEEDFMHELVESYSALKLQDSTEEDPYFLVIITEKDGLSIEYYQPEFATHDDIAGSLKRLKDLLYKEE